MTSGNASDEPICLNNDEALERLGGHRRLLAAARPGHRAAGRRFGGPGSGRRTPCCSAAAGVTRRCRSAWKIRRRRPGHPGRRPRTEKHRLPAEGGPGLPQPPHRRSGEPEGLRILHRNRRHPAGCPGERARRSSPTTCTPGTSAPAGPRSRPADSAPGTGAAPSRPSGGGHGRTRPGPAGHRADHGRHRLRHRRHHLGRGDPGRRPGGFRRVGHFDPVPLPGGDAAIRAPWRTAVSYLRHAFGEELPPPALVCRTSRWPRSGDAGQGRELTADQQLRPAVRRRGRPDRPVAGGRIRSPGRHRVDGLDHRSRSPGRGIRFWKSPPGGTLRLRTSTGETVLRRFRWPRSSGALVSALAAGAPAAEISARFHRTLLDLFWPPPRASRPSGPA